MTQIISRDIQYEFLVATPEKFKEEWRISVVRRTDTESTTMRKYALDTLSALEGGVSLARALIRNRSRRGEFELVHPNGGRSRGV